MAASPRSPRPAHAAPRDNCGSALAAMSRGVLAVLGCPDVESAAARILASCRELIGAREGRLALLSPEGAGRWIARIGPRGRPTARPPGRVRPSASPARLAALAGPGLVRNDLPGPEPRLPLPRGGAGWRSVLAVPLGSREEPVGVLLLGDKPGGFSERDRLVASSFAALAAAAHQRCLASEDLERKVAAGRRELARANAALRLRVARYDEMRNSLRKEHAFRAAVEDSLLTGIVASDLEGRILHVNRAFVKLMRFPRRELVGSLPPHPFWPPEKREEYLAGLRNLDATQPRRAGYRRRFVKRNGEPIDVWLSVSPLREPGGAVTGWVASVGDFTEQLRIEAALRRAAEQLRLVSARLIEAEERERKRIARELHDSLGQTLTALRYRIEEALGECRRCPGAPGGARRRLEEAVGILGDAAAEVRNIVSDLRPAILDDLGLSSAIRWFCREFQGSNPGISCQVSLGARDGEIPEELKTVVFRLVQEGLTNVSRHSRARSARVRLIQRPDRVELTIEDDGRGFRRNASARGAGLAGMRERVQLSGGSFALSTGPRSGTRIRAVWLLGGNG